MAINEKINEYPKINHALVKIETCIDIDQSESGYAPGQRATMRYQERGLAHN